MIDIRGGCLACLLSEFKQPDDRRNLAVIVAQQSDPFPMADSPAAGSGVLELPDSTLQPTQRTPRTKARHVWRYARDPFRQAHCGTADQGSS